MTKFRIKSVGKNIFAVFDDSDNRASDPMSFETAQSQLAALEKAGKENRDSQPRVVEERQRKALYRNPVFRAFKGLFNNRPERLTRSSHQNGLKFVADPPRFVYTTNWRTIIPNFRAIDHAPPREHMSIASSDPVLHTELNKSPAQRKTSPATLANDSRGHETTSAIAERWRALTAIPERKRSHVIANELGLDPRHVRRVRPR